MMKKLFLLCLVTFLQTLVVSKKTKPLLVNTSYGSIFGKLMEAHNGREFAAFLGIPYATPPSGKLRFMPPTPPQKWEGVRNATVEGNACIQRVLNGSEDCLYLNVFTHYTNNFKNTDKVWPVMVYIHGGGFYVGSSSTRLYGPEYLMDRDIVLVTLQYRLGVFGFLSAEDTVISGNMGLKDQVLALRWVQENIHSFGGDQSKVTIFGNSAGAASVHLHMLSPLSKDLFARAISQSGTAQSAFAMIGRGTSRNLTFTLAEHLNCVARNTSEQILDCLQNRDSLDIQKEYSKLQDASFEIKRALLRPVVEEPSEHAFLTSSPLETTSKKPWLVGLNGNEGLFKITMPSFNKTRTLIHSEFVKFGPAILFFDDTCSNSAEVAELIYDFYFKNASSTNEMIQSLEQVISDSYFVWPTMQAIENHNGALYCYLFNHSGEHSYTEVREGPQGFGVCHMDELRYLFTQQELFSVMLNEADSNISKLLVDLWVNFAEQENPTPHPININPQVETEGKIIWTPSLNKSDPRFLLVETNTLSMLKDIFSQRTNFWRYLPVRDKLKEL